MSAFLHAGSLKQCHICTMTVQHSCHIIATFSRNSYNKYFANVGQKCFEHVKKPLGNLVVLKTSRNLGINIAQILHKFNKTRLPQTTFLMMTMQIIVRSCGIFSQILHEYCTILTKVIAYLACQSFSGCNANVLKMFVGNCATSLLW